jgi:hypothetical protein
MSGNIVDFPGADQPPIAETDIEALHAEAFRDLENRLNDCVSMAAIAAEQIHNHKTDDRELVFAVAHTWEMLAKLKRDYYATYHNEKPGGLHTSST